MGDSLSGFFEEHEFGDSNLVGDDLFSIFETLEGVAEFPPIDEVVETPRLLASQKSTSSCSALQELETELETSPKSKRQKLAGLMNSSEEANPEGQQKVSHITVERNRRKQMNEHLSVLRSLMPCFYVKRVSYSSIHEYFARLSTSQKEKKKVRYLNYSMSNERGFLIYNDFHLLLCNQKQKLFRVTSLSILDQPFMV